MLRSRGTKSKFVCDNKTVCVPNLVHFSDLSCIHLIRDRQFFPEGVGQILKKIPAQLSQKKNREWWHKAKKYIAASEIKFKQNF